MQAFPHIQEIIFRVVNKLDGYVIDMIAGSNLIA